MRFPAIELTASCDAHLFKQTHGIPLPHIVNSDAHTLEQLPDPRSKIRLGRLCALEVIRAIKSSREDPKNLT